MLRREPLPSERRGSSVDESVERAAALSRQDRLRSCQMLLNSWDSTACAITRRSVNDAAAATAAATTASPSREPHGTPLQLTDIALPPPAAPGAEAAALAAAAATAAAVAADAASPRSKWTRLPFTTNGWKGIIVVLLLCVASFFAGYWLRFRIDDAAACVGHRDNEIDILAALERDPASWEHDAKIMAQNSHPAVDDLG